MDELLLLGVIFFFSPAARLSSLVMELFAAKVKKHPDTSVKTMSLKLSVCQHIAGGHTSYLNNNNTECMTAFPEDMISLKPSNSPACVSVCL